MQNIILALGAFALIAPATAYKDNVNYTVKFDNLQGTTVPDGYGGLIFSNFEIAQAQNFLNPRSPPNMIASTDVFGMKISIDQKTAQDFLTINSVYMSCLSCFGSICYPAPAECEITAVAYISEFPSSQVAKAVFQYTPPPNGGQQYDPNTTMVKVLPTGGDRSLMGNDIRLFLTKGAIGTTVYFDNINYHFGY